MARRRFFVDEVRRGEAELEGEEAEHLTRVLRAEIGQQYEICDGARLYLSEIVEARKRSVRFRILEELPAAEPVVRICLMMSLIKFERFDGMKQDAAGIWTTPDGGGKVCWFKDPDGNVLSVSQHVR